MDNTTTVQKIYEAFGKGDIPAILSHLHAEVEWEHDATDHGIPWLAPRRGREAVAEFFATLAQLDIQHFEPRNLLAGGNQVAAVIAIEAEVRATGKKFRDLEMHLWTFDEQGMVTRFRHVADTHQHYLAYQGQN